VIEIKRIACGGVGADRSGWKGNKMSSQGVQDICGQEHVVEGELKRKGQGKESRKGRV
jgi:hypothetical protein